MPLYAQNGKLIQKAGALGTSAGCCCKASGPQCCCDPPWGPKLPANCASTTSPLTSPRPTLSQISILLDWDGLSVLLEPPYFSSYVSESVSFSCLKQGESEALNITERVLTANANVYQQGRFGQGDSSGCWVSPFYSVTGTFTGTYPSNGSYGVASNTGFPFVAECKLEDELNLNTPNAGWCDDNPYGPITVEMISAP